VRNAKTSHGKPPGPTHSKGASATMDREPQTRRHSSDPRFHSCSDGDRICRMNDVTR
jgi:hypothetical protein